MDISDFAMKDSTDLDSREIHISKGEEHLNPRDSDAIMDSDNTVQPLTETVDDKNSIEMCRHSMLTRVAMSDAYFKKQQLSDPDLTFSEKFSIVSELLDSKPAVFLERYEKYLTENDFAYFEQFRGDYVIDFYLRKLTKRFSSAANEKQKVKNRRYEAMKRLISNGEYFSDNEMKKRDPLLFEEMIGQYQTLDDVADSIPKSDLSLSEVLLQHLQVMQNNELYDQQCAAKSAAIEEYDSDEEDSESESEIDDQIEQKDKEVLRSEFVDIMKQRFLSGMDQDFNYCEVDNSEEYDSLDMINRDEEERYFEDAGSDDLDFFCEADEN